MTDIFLSRPTWVSPEFEPGLANFYKLLAMVQLNPRTLGVGADRPTVSPMDEVIALMNECRGAVILGFPQIIVASGRCKADEIASNLVLGTEWNHIEAGLAYARGLPLLAVHHVGVSRGIFDRGAINSFIHQVDLSSPAWALDETVTGALKKWSEKVVRNPARQALVERNDGRRALREEEIIALKVMAENAFCDVDLLASQMKVPTARAKYYIDGLAARGESPEWHQTRLGASGAHRMT
ncbi:MAG: hypothetical protein WCG85_25570 [Polyangia bacterium]